MGWKEIAIPLVAVFEGLHKKGKDGMIYPYLDKLAKPQLWTRGYGRTYGITETSPPVTKAEAMNELGVGLEVYANKCVRLSPNLACQPYCLAAVTSWSWNCGVGAFKVSRLRRAVNEGRWKDASELIKKPRTAGGVEYRGLVRRRDMEADIFKNGLT